jgi:thermostable 8-oxoguanine DNA glycosylase
MRKQELLNWFNRYNGEEGEYDLSIESGIGNKLRTTKELTKEDLVEIIKWKFRGKLLGRRKIMLNHISSVSDSDIKKLSNLALNEKDDKRKIEIIRKIKGVGISLASCIFTFYDPKNYCIYDIHIWRELFGQEPKDMFTKADNYLTLLKEIRRIANENSMNVRDVEKALFQKNLVNSKSN